MLCEGTLELFDFHSFKLPGFRTDQGATLKNGSYEGSKRDAVCFLLNSELCKAVKLIYLLSYFPRNLRKINHLAAENRPAHY